MTDTPLSPPPDRPLPPSPLPDARPHWSHRLPARARPFAALARWDRPVGYWLLALPGWVGIAFARLAGGWRLSDATLALLILVGAVAMRGAGCTYNDIVDADLDGRVERTRGRPLPSGQVGKGAAWVWLAAQCGVGLFVLFALPNTLSQLVALASLPLVALYPFMKRVTGFPQVWLGLTFNWAALVVFAAVTGHVGAPIVWLYLGLAAWTVGYDTIYALQDIEDDQLAGIKSSAISFGRGVRWGVGGSYALSVALVAWAVGLRGWQPVGALVSDLYYITVDGWDVSALPPPWQGLLFGLATALPFALHLAWQTAWLRPRNPARALRLFKSNGWAALLLLAGLALQGVHIRHIVDAALTGG